MKKLLVTMLIIMVTGGISSSFIACNDDSNTGNNDKVVAGVDDKDDDDDKDDTDDIDDKDDVNDNDDDKNDDIDDKNDDADDSDDKDDNADDKDDADDADDKDDDIDDDKNELKGIFSVGELSNEEKSSLDYVKDLWVKSDDSDESLCLVGKGEGADEGYGSVIIKDDDGDMKSIKLIDETKTQTTITQACFIDDDEIAVQIGGAFGTVITGKKVYAVDIEDGDARLLYEATDDKTAIKSISVKDGKLNMNLVIYKDDIYNEYDETSKSIDIK